MGLPNRVLKWAASIGEPFTIPAHKEERICLVGRQSDQPVHEFCVWITDHFIGDDRAGTKWGRTFIAVGAGVQIGIHRGGAGWYCRALVSAPPMYDGPVRYSPATEADTRFSQAE